MNRSRLPRLRVLVLASLLAAALLAPAVPGAQATPRLHVDTVCFTVHNTGDPLPSTLYGQRFTVGKPTSAAPAIVLVHGVAVTGAYWDLTPDWSVARMLARRGYVVFSYDRLGFGKSTYDRPNGGHLVTTPNQRDILHQLVGEVKSGDYGVTSAANDCSASQTRSRLASPTVVLSGHSAGGGIVQGYAGKYHDVAAVVQNSYSNRGNGAVVDRQLTEVVVPALARGEDYVPFFRTRRECEDFNIWPPGQVPKVVRIACAPSDFVLTPAGEWEGFVALQQENDQYVKLTGDIPVLLTYGDHDAAFPIETAQADEAYWRANCACDVTSYYEPATGHLFMAHVVLDEWVERVASWLAARGIAAG